MDHLIECSVPNLNESDDGNLKCYPAFFNAAEVIMCVSTRSNLHSRPLCQLFFKSGQTMVVDCSPSEMLSTIKEATL